MATALAKGCVASALTDGPHVSASDPSEAARAHFSQHVPGARVVEQNARVLEAADAIVLAVKPQVMSDALKTLVPHLERRHLLISIAAGIRLGRLAEQLPEGARLVRVMPNTPCLVGYGASCFALGADANEADADLVRKLLGAVGDVHQVDEENLDAVTGLSGSGPAFVYTVIEALAAGGASQGLPRDLALQLAVQTTLGAAEMVQQTGLSPAELRDQVTSPGGTTLAGLEALDQARGPAAFQAAVEAATRRSQELSGS